jgi:M6 family metalloprotease-like protein
MKFNTLKVLLTVFFVFLISDSDLYSVSLSPEVVEKLKKEGRLEEVVRQANLAREKGVWQPSPNPPLRLGKGGSIGGSFAVDTLKPIVICVDFSDKPYTYPAGKFDTLLFSQGFAFPTGSMRDFYLENSYGKLDLVGGVTGWYRMPQTYSYYVWRGYGYVFPYPHNAKKLVEDAVNAANPYVNFADYDHNGDGWVDALIIIHAGPGAEETGDSNDIWSHKWAMDSILTRDGVKLHEYNMDPEKKYPTGALVNMGVFAHEFGHNLGLPDLYDLDYSSNGLGNWSVMSHGSWNNGGKSPAHFDAWSKKQLGWGNVNQLDSNQTNVEILQAETSPVSYRLWTSGDGGSQYFLVENRQRVGFDKYLPGDGLLIYHVDEGMADNDSQWCPGYPATLHYKVALEQADGLFQLEGCNGLNYGTGGNPFPGVYDKRDFDDTTVPSTRNYSNGQTQVAVWNISNSGSSMLANMDVTWSRPGLRLDEFTLNDSPPRGDGDGKPEAGETVRLYFTISNIWLTINSTTVTGSADTAGINFTDNSSYLGNIVTGDSANNHSDSMEFVVDPLFPERVDTFTLHVVGNTTYGTYTHDFKIEVLAGGTGIFDSEEEYTNVPKSIELLQNYPNPFNSTTSIRFIVNGGRSPLRTSLKVYNIRGQLVRTLVDEDKPGGNYLFLWDGKDDGGEAVPSGIYFYKLTAGSSSEVKKMVLLK